ncbi:MAG: NAD(P)-binding domain-containing protein [Aquificota bacterium]|nr:NAD(P)-binding domain-containing protein [Aquificota bacterium]
MWYARIRKLLKGSSGRGSDEGGCCGFREYGVRLCGRAFGKIGKEKVLVFDTDPAKRDLAVEMGFPVASDLMFLVRESDLILLAVKPKDVKGVLEAIREDLEGRILGSVAAGVDTGTLKELSRYGQAGETHAQHKRQGQEGSDSHHLRARALREREDRGDGPLLRLRKPVHTAREPL